MAEEALTTVEVIIAGRKYPVKIASSEANMLTVVQDRLNADLHEVQLSYAGRDLQDRLAMTLLQYAVSVETHTRKLSALADKVDEAL